MLDKIREKSTVRISKSHHIVQESQEGEFRVTGHHVKDGISLQFLHLNVSVYVCPAYVIRWCKNEQVGKSRI